MAIVCDICKREVDLISFGSGFVGICCKMVLYNSTEKSQFDMKPDVKKDMDMHHSPGKKVLSSKTW